MTNWMTYFQVFKKRVIKDGIYIIKGYEKIISDHTGLSLMAGAIFLKSGAGLHSFLIVTPGYIILIIVLGIYIKQWRDKK